MEADPAPVPTNAPGDVQEKLHAARREAIDLLQEAERLEAEARDVRRRSRAKLKHYERMLAEHQGQLSVLDLEGVSE